jgi:RNA polymerase sigma-70 factor, ECF subfamily
VDPRGLHSKFEATVLLHMDAAYNLAKWLVHNEQDAQDLTQEACLRALRAFDTFHGGDARAWLLTIVRNTCFSWLRRAKEQTVDDLPETSGEDEQFDPQAIAMRAADAQAVRQAIDHLPPVLREAIVLREMEGMSYRQISQVSGAPVGTVMSRLARGRRQLAQLLTEPTKVKG